MAKTPQSNVKWGPVELSEGVTPVNAWGFMLASFVGIGLLSFFNFGQAYILNEILKIPQEEQGTLTGNLQVWAEVIQIALIPVAGVLSDRIGRRPVAVAGLVFLGIGYALFPFASNVSELFIYRTFHGIGASCIAAMLATIVNDYPRNSDRGKYIGVSSIFNALGVIVLGAALGGLPAILEGVVDKPSDAARTAWVFVGGLCLLSGLILRFMLKGGIPAKLQDHIPFRELWISGIKATKNPRVALAYGNSFAARGDLTIVAVFISLWGQKVGIANGMTPAAAMGAAVLPFVIAQITALIWSPIMGVILDRINRVSAMALAAGLSAFGYLSMYLVSDPLSPATFPLFAFLGLGYVSGLLASTALIGQEAPVENRGAVIGFFGMCGAIGILVSVSVGGRLYDIFPSGPFVFMGAINVLLFIWSLFVRFTAGEPEVQRSGLSVVVTGSTRGIGLGLAKNFIEHGNHVFITSRGQASVDKAVAELTPLAEKHKVKVSGAPCDIGDVAQAQQLWDNAVKAFGKVDIWINNAGIANQMMPIAALPPEQFDTVVKTNITGIVNSSRIALKGMEAQGFGEIYNFEGFGSDGNQSPGMSVYGSTKNAITYFTNALIKETKGGLVKVGFLSPGIVITDMSVGEGQIDPERYEKTKKVYNIIGDTIDTVTPWLTRQTLLNQRHGARIAWLTRGKAMWRFMTAKWNKRDLFAEVEGRAG